MSQKKIESEKVIERKLVELCKEKNGMCIKLLSNHILGLPDRLCLFQKAQVVFVELKTTGQKPKKIQLFIHKQLKALGFRVEVIDTIEGVNNFINSIKYDADRK